ncbi:unnamed protein product, partial [Rotaria sp. Silwood2]
MQLSSVSLLIPFLLLIIASIILFWNGKSYPQISLILMNDCHLSLIESDHFICESNHVWNERKNVYQIQDKKNMMKFTSNLFFLSNWEPNFHCSHARRIGKMGDGGKWVCDPYRLKSRLDCLIYSAGSKRDFSF